MNIHLIAHQTYGYKGVIYRAKEVKQVSDELAQDLLSLATEEGAPVFAEYGGEVPEDGIVAEPEKKPVKTSTVVFGKKPAAPAPGKGGAKGGGDLKTVTV